MSADLISVNCLAVETATEKGSVALQFDGELSTRLLSRGRNSSRELYQAVREVLDERGIKVEALDCVGFGHGPGSFTGVRVAASAAQSLSYTARIPVCGVSTLAALALTVAGPEAHTVAACLDARMGEVYVGLYRVSDDGQVETLQDDALARPTDYRLPESLDAVFAAGPGWAAYPELLENNRGRIDGRDLDVLPEASAVLQLAAERYRRGDTQQAFEALPNYLRNEVTQ